MSAMIQDLFEVAESAATLKVDLETGGLSSHLSALEQVCNAVRHGWSGSNIGNHATVYWVGLEAKPAGMEFSTEWAPMDRWPTHQPARGWTASHLKRTEMRAKKSELIGTNIFLGHGRSPTSDGAVPRTTGCRTRFAIMRSLWYASFTRTLARHWRARSCWNVMTCEFPRRRCAPGCGRPASGISGGTQADSATSLSPRACRRVGSDRWLGASLVRRSC
jgi:hypothetical protein